MKIVAITAALALAAFVRPSAAAFWGEGTLPIECHLLFCYLALTHAAGSDSDTSLQCSAYSRQMLQMLLSDQTCSSNNGCPSNMVCLSGKCSVCSSDTQCEARNLHNRCMSSSSHDGRFCAHKSFGDDFGAVDVLLLVITFLSTALSAPTGTGGGGIMVPVFMLLCGFTAQDAIPLSKVRRTVFNLIWQRFTRCVQATIFGLALSNNYLNMQKKHPTVCCKVIV
jgi:hypothetical protein